MTIEENRPGWARTRVAERLGLRYPIIQGPFGGGLSSVQLTAAVSNAGGLGSFGAHGLAAAEICAVAQEIRAHTRRPFALNLWVLDHDGDGHHLSKEAFTQNVQRLRPFFEELNLPEPSYPERFGQKFEEQIGALFEAKPPVFSFVYGVPSKTVLAECRRLGIATLGTATTPDEAAALDDAGVDGIVASGFEAGGHRGSFIKSAEESLTGTLSLVPQAASRVRAPVIAAGGIADGRGIAAALALGAEAVQIGTAFLACEESGAHPEHRQALFSPAAKHTALTRALTGRLARGIRNRFITETDRSPGEWPPYPSQGWFTQQIKSAAYAQGRLDLASMWSGQSAPLLKHHRAVELFESLVEETTAAIARLSGS